MTTQALFLDAVYAASAIHRPASNEQKVVCYLEKITNYFNFTEPFTHLCDAAMRHYGESCWDRGEVAIMTVDEAEYLKDMREYIKRESIRAAKSFIKRMPLTRSQRKACRHFYPILWGRHALSATGLVLNPTFEEHLQTIATLDGEWQTIEVNHPQNLIQSSANFIMFWTNGLSSPAGSWFESDISYQIGTSRWIRWGDRHHFEGNTSYTVYVPV